MLRSLRLAPLALACALAFGGGQVRAQEPTPAHLESAKELIRATGSLTSLDEIVPALVAEVKKQGLTRPEMAKDLDEVLKQIAPEMELQRQQAYTIAARIYAKWLTEPEIKELVVFFKSPIGAKFAKIQPDLSEDVVEGIQRWSQQVSEYVMVRTRVEMGKRGHQMQ